ncbi:MAG: HlyC/CorC family transporter [Rhodospirillaceae bacterium]|nr:HlyC/CorC family transporter [Rhodospirillaceae bacterium]
MDLFVILNTLAILLLLALSAFFSGSETALTAASHARMHQLAQDGDARAKMVNRLRENKEHLIGAILLGNNLVNILATAMATAVLTTLVGEAAVPLATVIMTLLVLIFAEVLPKTYAIQHADPMARGIAPVLRMVIAALFPIVKAITFLVRMLLRLFGAGRSAISMGDYVDELRGAIELHRGPEQDVAVERAMLRSILELGEVEVAEIMTHRRNVLAVDVDQPVSEIIATVVDSPYTRVPLFESDADNVIGVLHAKDLLRAVRRHDGDLTQAAITELAAKPWFIPDTTSLIDQLQAFRTRREHFALVVDEYGSLQGVVTLEDILEEIVGEIADEHDLPVAGVRPQPNGSLLIDGTVTIRDLNRRFEWRLPDDSASTIAGLVLYEAQRIPEVGQVFTFHGFRFEILRRQRNQITLLRLTPPSDTEDAGA